MVPGFALIEYPIDNRSHYPGPGLADAKYKHPAVKWHYKSQSVNERLANV